MGASPCGGPEVRRGIQGIEGRERGLREMEGDGQDQRGEAGVGGANLQRHLWGRAGTSFPRDLPGLLGASYCSGPGPPPRPHCPEQALRHPALLPAVLCFTPSTTTSLMDLCVRRVLP